MEVDGMACCMTMFLYKQVVVHVTVVLDWRIGCTAPRDCHGTVDSPKPVANEHFVLFPKAHWALASCKAIR